MCHGPSLAETLYDIAEPPNRGDEPGPFYLTLAVNLAWTLRNHPGRLGTFLAEQVTCDAVHH